MPTLRPMLVETAAPVTPSLGNGPRPMMKQGSRQRLMKLASHKTRMATAASPRWATQNMSTMPNNASIAISRTMGTASKMMARLIEIAVKSWREPKIASLTRDRNVAVRDCWEVCAIELKRLSIRLLSKKYCAEAETQL